MASRIPNCFENLNGLLAQTVSAGQKGASGAVTRLSCNCNTRSMPRSYSGVLGAQSVFTERPAHQGESQ
jgi:hypothetical protein